jgi:hypothetical protein
MEAKEFHPIYEAWNERQGLRLISIREISLTFIRQFASTLKTPWSYADARGGREPINRLGLQRFEITYMLDCEGVVRYRDNGITSSATFQQVLDGISKKHLFVA